MEIENHPDYARAQQEYIEEYNKYSQLSNRYNDYKTNNEQFLKQIAFADEAITKHLGRKDYTAQDVNAIKN